MEEPEYYNLDLPIEAIKIIHKSLSFHHEKWPGGEPHEQEDIRMMRDNFYRIMLEHRFQSM